MHPVITMKHWSHQLHDGMLTTRHQIVQHLCSRHFWTGIAVALLVISVLMLLFIIAKNAPLNAEGYTGVPYGPAL